MSLEIIKGVGQPIFQINNRKFLYFKNMKIFLYDFKENSSENIIQISNKWYYKFFSHFKILQRLFRIEIRNFTQINKNEYIFSFNKTIYILNIEEKSLKEDLILDKELSNPLNISVIKGIEGFDDCIVFGEYFNNDDKREVYIYLKNYNKNIWEKIKVFDKNSIKHIHNIIPIKSRNSVIVLTGDEDKESGIWEFKNKFKIKNKLFIGNQQFRCCNFFEYKNCFIYATDSNYEFNNVYIINDLDDHPLKIYELNGSCINSKMIENRIFFSTAVEASEEDKYKNLLTRKIGKGIKTPYTTLCMLQDNKFYEIAKYKKDFFPMGLFQFGNIQFCSHDVDNDFNYILLFTTSIKKYDRVCFKLNIN